MNMERELSRLNEQSVDMWICMARHDACPPLELVEHLKPALLKLGTGGRRRLAQRPFLLMGLKFQDAEWCERAVARAGKVTQPVWRSHYPRRSAIQLARGMLTLAGVMLAHRPLAYVCMKLGLSPEVAKIIAKSSLSELETIAQRYFTLMLPRWSDRPLVWQYFLQVAQAAEEEAVHGFGLHCAELLAGDLLGHRG
jgi:hypothetical protein